MMYTFRLFIMVCVTILIAGCKLTVIVVEGGVVQSEGSGTCTAGSFCVIEVDATDFSETFTAVAAEDWYFHEWQSGKNFLCADALLAQCELSFEGFETNPFVEAAVDSSATYYLMPVFKDYPRATLGDEARTISVDGINQLWLQPKDFIVYSYDQVSEVCPEGVCSGFLPDSTIDLTGYFWASSSDVALLFLAYQQAGRSMLLEFKDTFPTPGSRSVIGLLSDKPRGPEKYVIFGSAGGAGEEYYSIGDNEWRLTQSGTNHLAGVWFWRPVD
jgi:hypothetical protein